MILQKIARLMFLNSWNSQLLLCCNCERVQATAIFEAEQLHGFLVTSHQQCTQVYRRAFEENRPSNARIFVILPVYLWFLACSEHYRAAWQTGQQRSERALNHKKTTTSQKLEFHPSLRPSNALIFVQKTPVFLQKWARLKNWVHCITINNGLSITITIIIITINRSYHYHYLPSPGHHQHRFASNTLCHLV